MISSTLPFVPHGFVARSLTLVFSALLGVSGLPGPLGAQSAPTPSAAADPVRLDRLVVTGSNIKRLDLEKVAPMTCSVCRNSGSPWSM